MNKYRIYYIWEGTYYTLIDSIILVSSIMNIIFWPLIVNLTIVRVRLYMALNFIKLGIDIFCLFFKLSDLLLKKIHHKNPPIVIFYLISNLVKLFYFIVQ